MPFAGIAPFGHMPTRPTTLPAPSPAGPTPSDRPTTGQSTTGQSAAGRPAAGRPPVPTAPTQELERPVFIPHPPNRQPPAAVNASMPPLSRASPDPAVPSKRLRRRVVGGSAVLLLITGIGAYANWMQHSPDRAATQDAVPPAPAPPVPAPSRGNPIDSGAVVDTGVRSISAPLGDRSDLTFRLLTDTTRSVLRTAELGDQLYIISTTDASAAPTVTAKGSTVALSLARTGQPGTVAVDVRLNKRVDWKLVVAGSAAEHVIDMRAGGLAGLELAGDASRIVLSLPKPDGTLPITMTGGASAVDVHAPAGVPVRIRLGAGARNSSIDGTPQALAKPDAALTPPEWKGAANRYDFEATDPIDTLSLDRRKLG